MKVKRLQLECQECGKIFYYPQTKCPKCGSYDVDVTSAPENKIEWLQVKDLA